MMKNKVLLTHSYFYKFDPKQWKSKRYYPPLGTLYAASILREAGAEVIFQDNCLANDTKAVKSKLEAHKPELLIIYDDGFNYLTKMCLTNMRDAAFEMIELGKSQGCKVVVCSSDSSDHYSDYLEKGADYIILGEGEETLKVLNKYMFSERFNPVKIEGIAYQKEGKSMKNMSRLAIDRLDSIPLPAWDLVDMERYKRIWLKNHGYFSINLATTRGCPYNCNWCAKPIYGQQYNSRSPENVIQEMELLISKYGVSHFWICDDIFGLAKGWMSRFKKLVSRKGLKFSYTVQSRADLVIRETMAEDLAATGADTVWLGAESGSQKILDAMNKGQMVGEIVEARKILQKNGVKTAFFIQFGYLGEDMHDIRKTINMILTLMPDDIGISISYPLPGTTFHKQVKEELGEKANWSDSSDLALMYKGNFTPEFYRTLHAYVHRLFRRKQRLSKLKSSLFKPSTWNTRLFRDILSIAYYYPAIWMDSFKLKRLGNFEERE